MAQLMDHVTYLSKEIGPRPAGTEEEQRAALYITEQFQKETGFTAAMEDFSNSSNVEMGLAVMAAIAVVVTVLAIIFPALSIPAFILATAAAAVYALEELDRPIISKVLSRGASQNVVAKYQPMNESENMGSRRRSSRKIILMAHYDTGNVTPPLIARLEHSKVPVALICVGGIIASAFFLLVRIFVASGGGMGLLVLNVLSIVAALICLYPIVKAALVRTSPYNEGATNNATGTAALIEVARRIARGSVSEAELAIVNDDVVIHGEEAAREAGLIPEGVELVYEAEKAIPPVENDDFDEEERLLSAKAAIAALTGRPVESKVYGSLKHDWASGANEGEGLEAYDNSVYYDEHGMPYKEESQASEPVSALETGAAGDVRDYEEESSDGFENAPSWFIAAQQNARKSGNANADKEPQIKRSRYTEAIETAERNFAQREQEMEAAKKAEREAAQKAREEEFRALMEARAAAEREAAQSAAAESRKAGYAFDEGGSDQREPYAQGMFEPIEVDPLDWQQQRPDSTVAMGAPTPSAEIIAEALAEMEGSPAGQPAPSSEDDARVSRTKLDAASIPIPPTEQDAQSQISALPSIDPANPYSTQTPDQRSQANLSAAVPEVISKPAPTDDPSRSGLLRKLRTSIPSLSGLISPVPSAEKQQEDKRSGSVDYSMELPLDTVSAPVAPMASSVAEVDVPRSRSGSFLNRLRQNDSEVLADTPQQWLDVDADFDPRRVGRERGGWESFRNDEPLEEKEAKAQAGDAQGTAERRWQGGAYSRVQLGHVDTRSGEDAEADVPHAEEPVAIEQDKPIAEEIEQIYHFRNPQFNTEVWFVAVGSDGESHDGARAFVEEHRDELRGALLIEIESLGAGDLSVASEEGRIRKAVVSSRIKRYTRAATAATGLAVSNVSLFGSDSIASTLQKEGFQAMHLFGAENGYPALKGSADDVAENVDELALEEHVDFIFELLKR